MRSPSFLSHRYLLSEGRGISNARTLFGMNRIPCDNHIRQIPDGIPPEHFDGVWLSEVPNGWIKEVLGLRRFNMRGLAKARGEWDLVCPALNIRRLQSLPAA